MSIIARIKDYLWNKRYGRNHKIIVELDRADLFAMLGGVQPDSINRVLFERLRLGHWDNEKKEWKWDFWSPSFGTCPQPSYVDKYQNDFLWILYNLIKSQRLQADTPIEDIDIEKMTIKEVKFIIEKYPDKADGIFAKMCDMMKDNINLQK